MSGILHEVLESFGINRDQIKITPFGNGLIHHTYLVSSTEKPEYILQEVNSGVFRHPMDIAYNLQLIGNYLRVKSPEYFLPLTEFTTTGEPFLKINDRYFRISRYVPGSHALQICSSPDEAFEAALQFGKFTAKLNGFDAGLLRYTIPGFHNLSQRWDQFRRAVAGGNQQRIAGSGNQIKWLEDQFPIVELYERIQTGNLIPKHVVHHDTKISNVLFDEAGKGICVIDLDTVMPGFFFSDLGDMMRTYLSTSGEEENDLHRIEVRTDFFEAIVNGYLKHMQSCLTDDEKQLFFYSGEFMIYMQAIRFMTDHLNDDIYYGAAYEGQNLNRALNQIDLLKKYRAKETEFRKIISHRLSFSSSSGV